MHGDKAPYGMRQARHSRSRGTQSVGAGLAALSFLVGWRAKKPTFPTFAGVVGCALSGRAVQSEVRAGLTALTLPSRLGQIGVVKTQRGVRTHLFFEANSPEDLMAVQDR